MDELRKKTVTGSFWALFERFGYLGIQFISNIVLARLLMPDDFGTIGLLTIFTSLSYVLIDSGLSSALIQKKSVTETDKSTVFFTNLVLAIVVYVIIFATAPLIARYFHNQSITVLLRVIELMVLIDAFAAIQSTCLTRDMDFKELAKYKIISIVIAVSVSIILALSGFGVWSLVIQYLLYSVCRAALLWYHTKWRPELSFSKQSFKSLFGFGSKLLISQYIAAIYDQLQSILIGRKFSAGNLGYYTQAKLLMQIPVDSLARVVNNVSFPAYSVMQNERDKLKMMVQQNLILLVFLNTPLMFYLSVVAKPLLVFLYSEKWLESVPYFQFLCIGYGLFSIIHNCSLTALKSVGRTDYVLRLEVIKKVFGVTFVLCGMNLFGIWGLMYGLALNSFIELFLNGYYLKKEIDYGTLEQIRDFIPSLLLSLVAATVTFFFVKFIFIDNNFIVIILSSIVFFSLYLIGAYLMKMEALSMARKVVITMLKKDK